jgi:hypothetical protein
VYVLATSLTNIGFKDNFVLKGQCPECGQQNFTYFGDILTVPGNRGTNAVSLLACSMAVMPSSQRQPFFLAVYRLHRQFCITAEHLGALLWQVDCGQCGAGLSFDENKRIVVIAESAEEKKKKAEAAAAKKAASAAKKAAKAKAKTA